MIYAKTVAEYGLTDTKIAVAPHAKRLCKGDIVRIEPPPECAIVTEAGDGELTLSRGIGGVVNPIPIGSRLVVVARAEGEEAEAE